MSDLSECVVPWKEGFWKMGGIRAYILQTSGKNTMLWKNLVALDYPDIDSDRCMKVECEFGSFGEAREEIASATGVKEYNFTAKSVLFSCKGVLHQDGTKMTTWGMSNEKEEWVWMDDQMMKDLMDDRDPYASPSCPHITPRSEKQGKIFWLSGPPGAGKSTTCQLMAKQNNFIYYEADCSIGLVNPFTDLDAENPSMASFAGPPLKDVPKEVASVVLRSARYWETPSMFSNFFLEKAKPIYKVMAEDIVRQKRRLGGTFAVAQAVVNRNIRDHLRTVIGQDLIFIVMNMTKECQSERLGERHGEGEVGEGLEEIHSIYEPAGEDEEGTYNVTIERGMSKQDVLQKVMLVINKTI